MYQTIKKKLEWERKRERNSRDEGERRARRKVGEANDVFAEQATGDGSDETVVRSFPFVFPFFLTQSGILFCGNRRCSFVFCFVLVFGEVIGWWVITRWRRSTMGCKSSMWIFTGLMTVYIFILFYFLFIDDFIFLRKKRVSV